MPFHVRVPYAISASHLAANPLHVIPCVKVRVRTGSTHQGKQLCPRAPCAQGEPELADHDEPGNEWYFGERAEIFDYKMLGEHPTKSGEVAGFAEYSVPKRKRCTQAGPPLPSPTACCTHTCHRQQGRRGKAEGPQGTQATCQLQLAINNLIP